MLGTLAKLLSHNTDMHSSDISASEAESFVYWFRFVVGLICGTASGVFNVRGFSPVAIVLILLFVPFGLLVSRTRLPVSSLRYTNVFGGFAMFLLTWIAFFSMQHEQPE